MTEMMNPAAPETPARRSRWKRRLVIGAVAVVGIGAVAAATAEPEEETLDNLAAGVLADTPIVRDAEQAAASSNDERPSTEYLDHVSSILNDSSVMMDEIVAVTDQAGVDFAGWTNGEYSDVTIGLWLSSSELVTRWRAAPPVPASLELCNEYVGDALLEYEDAMDIFSDEAIAGTFDRLPDAVGRMNDGNDMIGLASACFGF